MKITGTVREMKRVNMPAPLDKVHRVSQKDGKSRMKGCRSVMLNDTELLPRGMSGIYFRYKEKYGIKIFYSVHNDRCSKMKTVRKQFKKQMKLYKLGVSTLPHKIVTVKMDFDYYEKDMKFARHVKKGALGIKVTHVSFPEKAWEKYAQGYPYDWDCLDQEEHPLHNPAGYLAFCKKMKKILLKNKIYVCGGWPVKEQKNPKLGDGVYCMNKKRWFLVDCGD